MSHKSQQALGSDRRVRGGATPRENRVDVANAWLLQAKSDLRTAQALLLKPAPLEAGDVGCQVIAKLAQAVEKSIKGYLFLSRNEVKLTHRVDQYVHLLVDRTLDWSVPGHHDKLSELFDSDVKAKIKQLIDWTPGTQGRTDVANTEYPWVSHGVLTAPYASREFSRIELRAYEKVVSRIVGTLGKLWSAFSRRAQPEPRQRAERAESAQPSH